MQSFLLFLTSAITALALENAVFARGLGLGRKAMFMESVPAGILFGGMLTWMVTLSSLLAAAFNFLLMDNPYVLIIRPLGYLVGVFAVYMATGFVCIHALSEKNIQKVKTVMPISTFNSALFGSFYISVSQNFSVFQTVGYAFGSGVGYTMAIIVIYFARKRLAISPVPRAFKGLPILLIYLGLISLAIYGLIGHNLPT